MKPHFRTRTTIKPLNNINITPFVDVMLVLLIVFMITAPLLTVGVEVNLPKADVGALSEPEKPIVISISESKDVFLGSEKTSIEKLVPQIKAITKDNTNRAIYLRGDREVNYGTVMQIMAQLNRSGYTKIALVATNRKQPR